MTSPFNIATPTNSVTLDSQRTGRASFTVTNISANTVRSRARITSPDTSIVAWFAVEGQSGRVLTPAGTEQYTVQIAAPPTAVPREYMFSLLMVDESNPDENFTEGPAVKFTVPPPLPPPPPRPFPWSIVAVVIVVLILIAGGVGLVVTQNNLAHANATGTARAASSDATGTAQVANANATGTALALICHATVGRIDGNFFVDLGVSQISGGVTVSFALPQGNDQARQAFSAGSSLPISGEDYPICIFWSDTEFLCNQGNWQAVAGKITVERQGACGDTLPPGVTDVLVR